MSESSAKMTSPEYIEPGDRRFTPISEEVHDHYVRERVRDHPCGRVESKMLFCPHDECSRLIVCVNCGCVLMIMLPFERGWCEVAEAERQWQATP